MIKKNFLGAVLVGMFLAGTSYAQDATDQGNSSQGTGSGAEHSHALLHRKLLLLVPEKQ